MALMTRKQAQVDARVQKRYGGYLRVPKPGNVLARDVWNSYTDRLAGVEPSPTQQDLHIGTAGSPPTPALAQKPVQLAPPTNGQGPALTPATIPSSALVPSTDRLFRARGGVWDRTNAGGLSAPALTGLRGMLAANRGPVNMLDLGGGQFVSASNPDPRIFRTPAPTVNDDVVNDAQSRFPRPGGLRGTTATGESPADLHYRNLRNMGVPGYGGLTGDAAAAFTNDPNTVRVSPGGLRTWRRPSKAERVAAAENAGKAEIARIGAAGDYEKARLGAEATVKAAEIAGPRANSVNGEEYEKGPDGLWRGKSTKKPASPDVADRLDQTEFDQGRIQQAGGLDLTQEKTGGLFSRAKVWAWKRTSGAPELVSASELDLPDNKRMYDPLSPAEREAAKNKGKKPVNSMDFKTEDDILAAFQAGDIDENQARRAKDRLKK